MAACEPARVQFFAPLEASFEAARSDAPDFVIRKREPGYLRANGAKGPQRHYHIALEAFSCVYVFAESTASSSAGPILITAYPGPAAMHPPANDFAMFSGFSLLPIEDESNGLHGDIAVRVRNGRDLSAWHCDDGSASPWMSMLVVSGTLEVGISRKRLFGNRTIATRSIEIESGARGTLILRDGELVDAG